MVKAIHKARLVAKTVKSCFLYCMPLLPFRIVPTEKLSLEGEKFLQHSCMLTDGGTFSYTYLNNCVSAWLGPNETNSHPWFERDKYSIPSKECIVS